MKIKISNLRKVIKNEINKLLYEEISHEKDEFLDALEQINTLDWEEDQVIIPEFSDENYSFLFQLGTDLYFYIKDSEYDNFKRTGPFELIIKGQYDEDVIGFIRGTKNEAKKIISFNLIYLEPNSRNFGYGTQIYKYFLDNHYIIKSDTEITNSTKNLYIKLLNSGYKPVIFDEDDRVGLKK